MKLQILSLLATLVISANTFASNCSNEILYKNAGWVIHEPSEFEVIYKKVNTKIETGMNAQTLDYDVYAIYNFEHGTSLEKPDFIAEMNSWDDFSTSKDEMWGDIAIYTNHDHNSVPLEIHWYENGQRHIVINPLEVECINMPPTATVNSVY
ncbi:MAG: hypothetical protein EHM20_09920 [Alphaproteobacteria bacterium]|nr:MAG: hypothetical protein EHM20_09920 [Alphaproteobacteria bacterium]